jgi:dimethylhistidine N-methyltransferase
MELSCTALAQVRTQSRVRVVVAPSEPAASFRAAVVEGLSRPDKSLPCRFLYDHAGSQLFDEITRLPEYYLCRAEAEILTARARCIVESMPPQSQIVELGSGSSHKTRCLLRAALERGRTTYVPIDISRRQLESACDDLAREFPTLRILAIAGDYETAHKALGVSPTARLFLFLGSNIGNFVEAEACGFLSTMASMMEERDRSLVGIDLAKDAATIERAYNDAAGVTARFNLNILERINREFEGRFETAHFRHTAPYNKARRRVEMALVSRVPQEVEVAALGRTFAFEKDEPVSTEVCHKYTLPSFDALCSGVGLVRRAMWCDSQGRFASVLLARAT